MVDGFRPCGAISQEMVTINYSTKRNKLYTVFILVPKSMTCYGLKSYEITCDQKVLHYNTLLAQCSAYVSSVDLLVFISKSKTNNVYKVYLNCY